MTYRFEYIMCVHKNFEHNFRYQTAGTTHFLISISDASHFCIVSVLLVSTQVFLTVERYFTPLTHIVLLCTYIGIYYACGVDSNEILSFFSLLFKGSHYVLFSFF